MRWTTLGLLLAALPGLAQAQQPPADTGQADSLTRQPVMLHAVTIATTQARRDEPSSGTRLTPLLIRQTPAADAYDLMRQAAGLEVHDQGQGPGFASDVSVRGFSSDHSTDIALWIDGVPINEPVNGHAEGYSDWSLLMPEAISDVDVLKGPTSALYGNFAMAGAVNVRTLERLDGARAALTGGAYGRLEGTLLTGLDRGGTGAVAGLRMVREDGWRPHSAYELEQGHGRWVQRVSGVTTLDAGIELYGAQWDSPGFLADSAFRQRRYDLVTSRSDGGFKRRAQERVSLRVVGGSSLLWRSTAYATQGRWQLYLTTPPEPGSGEGSGSQTEEEDRRYGYGLTSALTWVLPRGEVTTGVEGRWDHSDYQNWFTTDRLRDSAQTVVSARQASAALFAQATLDLGRHVRASVGARYDALNTWSQFPAQAAASRGKGIFVPKLGLLYHLPRLGTLYANVSRGFRQSDGVIADPTLPFITERAYEVGAKLDRRVVSGSVALFRMDVSDEQTFDPITLRSTSGGASRRQGVEVELTVRPGASLALATDWTFNDARYRRLVTETDTLDGARVFNTAKYVGVASVSFAPPRSRWHARVATNVVGPYSPFDEPGVVLSSYALLHLSGGVRIGSWVELDVGVRNVLDRAYPELRAGGFVSPGEPRSVFASLRASP